MKNKKKINLPVIAEFVKEDLVITKFKKSKFKFIESAYYQTTKSFCDNFYKPLYLKKSDDK